MEWELIFDTVVDGRPVKGLIYSGEDLLVKTGLKYDFEGGVVDGVIWDPRPAGSPIEIHAQSKAELRNELIGDGDFTPAEADAIAEMFGTRGE